VSQQAGLIGKQQKRNPRQRGIFHMESRMVKFYSKDSNLLAVHAIPGHFATSHSHINYYVDVTSVKTRAAEAKEAAKVLYSKIPKANYIDTIVCMDGTEVIGAFLSQEIERGGILSTNQHETTYIVSPEINNNNQMLFRDNNKNAILGKHVVLLLGTTTTGETIRRSLECIRYYGGIIEFVASIFGTVDEVDGIEVDHLFDNDDVINYEAYPAGSCPFCKKGHKIEAMVNGFGYSKL
jgi:orotate phosphoribosyltransferase